MWGALSTKYYHNISSYYIFLIALALFHFGYRIHGIFANSEDSDEMLHYTAFYQGLHCLVR